MNAKDFDNADVDREERIRREEEELARLLGNVMRGPLSPVSESLARVEKQVDEVDETIRLIKDETLAGLPVEMMDLAAGFSRLESAVRDSGEMLGDTVSTKLGIRFDEARADVAAIGNAHERMHTEWVAALDESRLQVSAGIEALSAQSAAAVAGQQAADERLVAAVAMLRTGIDQQNEALKHAMTTLAQQLQAQQLANAEALASGLAEVTKRVGAVHCGVRWFGIIAAVCGLATLALILAHR
ncbi:MULTISPECIES: hypothetical protein [unclassified Paraburkholderia]|uniref:hypothetical protein n=1 Tax=unclassified Paraburkholderia TaxID=2615204 RepID=UPI002AB324D3|nr:MULTISPECIES: hypothetical protein [unclassified Paraburkholderia]